MCICSDRSVRSFALLSSALAAALLASACGSSEPSREAEPQASSSPVLPMQELPTAYRRMAERDIKGKLVLVN